MGDVDADGDFDALVVEGMDTRVWVNQGQASGVFSDTLPALTQALEPIEAVTLGDVDNDGDLDAYQVRLSGSGDEVWFNDGTGLFSDSGQSLDSWDSQDVALGDLDGDGDLDAFVVNALNQGNTVWFNTGLASGIFTDSGQSLGFANSYAVSLGDVDADGDLDALVANGGVSERSDVVYINDGAGSFTVVRAFGDALEAYGAALGDVDNDGDLDAVIADDNAALGLWLNEPPVCFAQLASDGSVTYTSLNADAVQQAVDAALTDDVVKIAGTCAGVAQIGGTWQTVYVDKPLTLRGGYTPGAWNTFDPAMYPALDAQGDGRVVLVTGPVSVTLEHLDIGYGDATGLGGGPWSYDGVGGGVYAVSATVTLRDNYIHDNVAGRNGWGGGGGVYFYDSQVTLEHNDIYWNTAGMSATAGLSGEGGALAFSASDATLNRNIIKENLASNAGFGLGGAIYVEEGNLTGDSNRLQNNAASTIDLGLGGGVFAGYNSHSSFINTVLQNNASGTTPDSSGAGLFLEGAIVDLLHTTFVNNTGGDGSGVYAYMGSAANLTNTLMSDHTVAITIAADSAANLVGVLWYNTVTPTGGDGTINVSNVITGDPVFAYDGYHIEVNSAVIDQGVDAGVLHDLDGEVRPHDLAPDLGADEYYPRCWSQDVGAGTTSYSSFGAQAVQAAVDAAAPGDVIKLAGKCVGVNDRMGLYQTVYISQPLTVRGGYTPTDWSVSDPVSYPTVLDAQLAGRVVYLDYAPATLENLHMRGGMIAGHGGGIYANQGLTLTNVHVVDNETQEGGRGGGVWVLGDATMTNVEVRGNFSSWDGGGVYVSGTLNIAGCHIPNNFASGYGGGVAVQGSLVMSDCELANNTAMVGGGLYLTDGSGVMTFTRFINNAASGGSGGGVYARQGLTVYRSRFIDNNTNVDGGGVYLEGNGFASRFVNTIFSRNYATDDGSALYLPEFDETSRADLIHVTIADPPVRANSAIYVPTGTVYITNTIFADHTVELLVLGAANVFEDYNLFDDVPNFTGVVNSGGHSLVGDPRFVDAGLDDFHLNAGSAAIDEGVDAGIADDFDLLPRPGGAAPDIGAHEAQFTTGVDVFGDDNIDNGNCTLREAVIAANTDSAVDLCPAGNGADTIVLAAGTYQLTIPGQGEDAAMSGDLDVQDALTITGAGPEVTFIDAGQIDRVFETHGFFESLVISGVTIMRGGGVTDGGGILAYDAGVVLINTHLRDNSATGDGGGLHVSHALLLDNSHVFSNTAMYHGGGMMVNQAALTVSDSTIHHNTVMNFNPGAGIYVGPGSTFSLVNVQIYANQAPNAAGGGLFSRGNGEIHTSQIYGNHAVDGGGIAMDEGAILLDNSQIEFNTADMGGGIHVTTSMPTLTVVLTQSAGTLIANNTANEGGGVRVSGGTMILEDGLIRDNGAVGRGGGVFVFDGQLVMNGGQILSNTAELDGGGVFVEHGGMQMSGGDVKSNTALSGGGGVMVNQPTATFTQTGGLIVANNAESGGGLGVGAGQAWLYGGSIRDNTAANYGGGLLVNGRAILDGGSILSNTANYGGGVYVGSAAAFTQTGVSYILSNTVMQAGGGIYAEGGTTLLEGGHVAVNAAPYGGGLYLNNGTAILRGTAEIHDNTALNNGGGVYVLSASAVFTQSDSSQIAHNRTINAGGFGGGLYVDDGRAWLTGGTVYSNTSNYGGGVHVSQGQTVLAGGVIAENAAQDGGGVHVNYGTSAFTQTSGLITDNTATRHGGGVYIASGSFALTGGQVINNTAAQRGGGLYAQFGIVDMYAGDIVSNTANLGGGVFMDISLGLWRQLGGSVNHNHAISQGGGVFLNYAPGEMSGGTVSANQAPSGGGVYVSGSSSVYTQTGGELSLNTADNGAGLYVAYGQATVANAQIFSNTAASNGGGAFVSSGDLVVSDGQIFDNIATGNGGGVYLFLPAATLTAENNSSIGGNRATLGGGLYVYSATATLSQSDLFGNTTAEDGAGLYNLGGIVTLVKTTVNDNGAGGLKYGGGAFNSGTLVVQDSTFYGNTAYRGGAIYTENLLDLTNSTITQNEADQNGGGIYNNGVFTATNVTITGNEATNGGPSGGGGVYNVTTAILKNTIIAGNSTGLDGAGTFTSLGYNLCLDPLSGLTESTDLVGLAPLLGPLQDNGGETWTHALLPGSPAINAGTCIDVPILDQRGLPRPDVDSGRCDIGAFEVQSLTNLPPIANAGPDQAVTVGVAGDARRQRQLRSRRAHAAHLHVDTNRRHGGFLDYNGFIRRVRRAGYARPACLHAHCA